MESAERLILLTEWRLITATLMQTVFKNKIKNKTYLQNLANNEIYIMCLLPPGKINVTIVAYKMEIIDKI
jgi:hypothetical protein